jgi:hypothetical protein
VLLNHSEPKLIKRRMIKNLLLELVQEQANFHNNKVRSSRKAQPNKLAEVAAFAVVQDAKQTRLIRGGRVCLPVL